MQNSSSWEASLFAASQETPRNLWNTKVNYAITSARHLSLAWASSMETIPSHPTSWRFILILSFHLHLHFPSGLSPSDFPTKTLYTPLLNPPQHTCYLPRPFHSSRFYHPNNIVQRVQIIKVLIMLFYPLPFYLFPLRTKYSPQHLILKHPQSTFFPQWFTPVKTMGKIIIINII